MIYLILFVACIVIEISPRINTDTVLKKIGIGFIAVGSLVEMYGHHSKFIAFGLIMYFMSNILESYYVKYKRRVMDK